jgi:hypothetical protein
MRLRTAEELREAAKDFRELAETGDDLRLREALLLVAEEFEREAARLDGIADGEGKPS